MPENFVGPLTPAGSYPSNPVTEDYNKLKKTEAVSQQYPGQLISAQDPGNLNKVQIGTDTPTTQSYQALTGPLISNNANPNVLSSSDAKAYSNNVQNNIQQAQSDLDLRIQSLQTPAEGPNAFDNNLQAAAKLAKEQALAKTKPAKEQLATGELQDTLTQKAASVAQGISGSDYGKAVMQGLVTQHQQAQGELHRQEAELLKEAWNSSLSGAISGVVAKDNALAGLQKAKQAENDDYAKKQKELLELDKMATDRADSTVQRMITAGYEPSQTQLSMLDAQYGLSDGTSMTLFAAAQSTKGIEDAKTEDEKRTKAIESAGKLVDLLNKVPTGQSVVIGGVEYTGQSRGDVKTGTETDSNGNVTFWSYNQDTNKIETTELGSIGKAEDGWTTQMDDNGNPWRFNAKTGQFLPFNPSLTTQQIQTIIPEGTTENPFRPGKTGVQCGEWQNDCNDPAIGRIWGDSLEQKLAVAKGNNPVTGESWAIPKEQAEVGDTVISSGSWTGHVWRILDQRTDPSGKKQWLAFEANYVPPGGGAISSTRWVNADDANIKAVARVPIRKEMMAGSDNATLPSTSQSTQTNMPTFGGKSKTSELDNLLSIDEATKLGVPYGTTKGQAAAKGITPTSATADKPTDIKTIDGKDYQWDTTKSGWVPFEPVVSPEQQAKASETKVSVLQDKINLIDSLLTSKGLAGSVGPYAVARWTPFQPDKADRQEFSAGVNQLISKETVDTLLNLKAQGGTLGALSDQERIMLQNAASKIGTWMQKDKNGNSTGKFEISEEAFKKELNNMKDLAQKAMTRAQGQPSKEQTQVLDGVTYSWDGTNWVSK
jgi:hypothetical protein